MFAFILALNNAEEDSTTCKLPIPKLSQKITALEFGTDDTKWNYVNSGNWESNSYLFIYKQNSFQLVTVSDKPQLIYLMSQQ